MPLKVSDGIGSWVKDFQKSKAPQFKGKNDEERRDMALAAYLSAKRGPEKEERVRQETLAAQGKDVFERQKGMFKGNNEAKVNEISKSTLTSYIKKAGQDKSRKWAQRDLGKRTSDDAYANQLKRNKGIDIAKSKMKPSKVAMKPSKVAASETTVKEISKNLAKSYIGKASRDDVQYEAHDPKHIKQAIGIASDPRYKKGNMTGAVKAMNKISKDIDKHPQVAAVLRRQNEATVKEISKNLAKSYIGKASRDVYDKGQQQGTANAISRLGGPDQDYKKSPERKAAKRVAGIDKATNRLMKKEAMSDAEKAAHQKAIDAFKAKGGKIKKLKPGYAQGYHGKDDPGAGMKGMLDRGDSKAIGTRKKARSLGASTTREWQEMYGDVILENTKLRKIRQLGMLGLVDKGDVQKLMNAMKAMDAGKEVPKPQRKIIFDAFGSLIDLVTGDTTVFQKAKKAVKEEVEKDPNEYDNEGEMMKDHLDIVMDAADEMYDMVADKENLPEWVQSKITKAADYLDTSRDYLMSQKRDKPTDATEGKTLSFDQMTMKMMHQEAIRLVRDTNALTRYKTMVNKKQVDDDSIRMAIDNPKHPEVKRLMKGKNFKTGLSHYKKALGVKETSIGYGKAMIKKQRDQKKALITPKDKNTLGRLAALMAKQPKRQT
jgi:hypothetical protein